MNPVLMQNYPGVRVLLAGRRAADEICGVSKRKSICRGC